MPEYDFELTIGHEPISDALADALHEAGCNDATLYHQHGRTCLAFTREAPDFTHAVLSALADVVTAGVPLSHILIGKLSAMQIGLNANGEGPETDVAKIVSHQYSVWDEAPTTVVVCPTLADAEDLARTFNATMPLVCKR